MDFSETWICTKFFQMFFFLKWHTVLFILTNLQLYCLPTVVLIELKAILESQLILQHNDN